MGYANYKFKFMQLGLRWQIKYAVNRRLFVDGINEIDLAILFRVI